LPGLVVSTDYPNKDNTDGFFCYPCVYRDNSLKTPAEQLEKALSISHIKL